VFFFNAAIRVILFNAINLSDADARILKSCTRRRTGTVQFRAYWKVVNQVQCEIQAEFVALDR